MVTHNKTWSPGVIFLVNIFSHVESDQHLFNIASHGGIIEIQRHFLHSIVIYDIVVDPCEVVSEVLTTLEMLPLYECCHCTTHSLLHCTTLTKMTGSRRNSDTLCTMANIECSLEILTTSSARCVAPVKSVRQNIFSTTPDTCTD